MFLNSRREKIVSESPIWNLCQAENSCFLRFASCDRRKTVVFNVSQTASGRKQMFSTFLRLRQTENSCFQRFAGRDRRKTVVFHVSGAPARQNPQGGRPSRGTGSGPKREKFSNRRKTGQKRTPVSIFCQDEVKKHNFCVLFFSKFG